MTAPPMSPKPPTAEQRAAQLWCLPQFSHRVMDPAFAHAIVDAIHAAKNAAREAVLVELQEWVPTVWPDLHDPMYVAGHGAVRQQLMREIARMRAQLKEASK